MSIDAILQSNSFFICPHCNRKQGSLFSLVVESEQLRCPNCSRIYPVLGGVPILADDILESGILTASSSLDGTFSSSNQAVEFYYNHYSSRSREADLASDYLLEERNFVKDFIQNNYINGFCLEVGCGTGIFADVSKNYIGLDYSLSSAFTEGFQNFARLIASAESIPLPDRSVQLVFSFNTLEHIPNPELAFQEIDRVLMPKGYAILHPAWHCTKYNTELLPIKAYKELNISQIIRKSFIPVLKSKPYKFLTRIPVRILRRLSQLLFNVELPTTLKYRKLTPYLGSEAYIADCDATADIDCHEGLLYFESRRYEIISHKTILSRLLAGNDVLVLQKSMN